MIIIQNVYFGHHYQIIWDLVYCEDKNISYYFCKIILRQRAGYEYDKYKKRRKSDWKEVYDWYHKYFDKDFQKFSWGDATYIKGTDSIYFPTEIIINYYW